MGSNLKTESVLLVLLLVWAAPGRPRRVGEDGCCEYIEGGLRDPSGRGDGRASDAGVVPALKCGEGVDDELDIPLPLPSLLGRGTPRAAPVYGVNEVGMNPGGGGPVPVTKV